MERQYSKSAKKKGAGGVDRTWSPVAAVLPNIWQVLVAGRLNLDCWASSISQFLETRLQQSKREGGFYEYAFKICRFIILRYLDFRINSVLKFVKWNKSLCFHLLSSRGYFYNPTVLVVLSPEDKTFGPGRNHSLNPIFSALLWSSSPLLQTLSPLCSICSCRQEVCERISNFGFSPRAVILPIWADCGHLRDHDDHLWGRDLRLDNR